MTLCVALTLQEIQLLKRISHDRNIVQFYGACLETKPSMLIMEYMGVRSQWLQCQVSSERPCSPAVMLYPYLSKCGVNPPRCTGNLHQVKNPLVLGRNQP